MATTAATAQAAEDAKLNHLVVTQLRKTKMCAMNQRGTCRDPKCTFAHSVEELCATPDLTKTAICRMFTRGQCRNASCKFAHGEQELRVTPQVYKTQLCNFFARGHCNKGKRCRHAHGEEELRASLQQQARTSSPAPSSGTQSAAELETMPYRNPGLVDEVVLPSHEQPDPRSLQTPPLAGCWGPNAPLPEWWAVMMASGGPNIPNIPALNTPPPSTMCYSPGVLQPTPEKVMPAFPGTQRCRPDSPLVAEPMKIALPGASHPGHTPTPSPPPVGVFPSPVPSPFDTAALANDFARMHSTASSLSGKDMMAMAMQEDASLLAAKNAALALTAQAKMDYELAAAQLKVKELQAKKQLLNAAQYAASITGAPSPNSHFEHIMQTLQQQQSPSRSSSPTESDALQMPMPVACTLPPPGLDTEKSGMFAGLSVPEFPQDGQRSRQFWHPADISLQRGTAWVI